MGNAKRTVNTECKTTAVWEKDGVLCTWWDQKGVVYYVCPFPTANDQCIYPNMVRVGQKTSHFAS